MDDSIRDCPESSRASKLTGLALRPYSPLSLGVLDQSGGPVVTRRGLAPLNVPDEITRIINISGKVLHDLKLVITRWLDSRFVSDEYWKCWLSETPTPADI